MDENELPKAPRGRIAPGSLLDTRDQLRLYTKAVGVEAARRQVRLVREELARRKKAKP